jgi:hypothetical protein
MLQLTHFKGPGPFSFAWCISKLQNIAGCNIADSSAAIGATRRLLQLRCKIQEDFANCIIVWANKDKKDLCPLHNHYNIKKAKRKFLKQKTNTKYKVFKLASNVRL